MQRIMITALFLAWSLPAQADIGWFCAALPEPAKMLLACTGGAQKIGLIPALYVPAGSYDATSADGSQASADSAVNAWAASAITVPFNGPAVR
jgi:hypothetical protein